MSHLAHDTSPRRVPVAQFIAMTADPFLRKVYEELLSVIPMIHEYARAISASADDIPELWIRTNSQTAETEVADLLQSVFLPDGLIAECLRLESLAASVTRGRIEVPAVLGSYSVAKACLLWAYGHEIFHYLRRHELVQRHFGSSKGTRLALEYDADLCSTAAVFRLVRSRSAGSSSIDTKRAVLINLFWLLREQSEDDIAHRIGRTETHLEPAERLLLIAGKLAALHDDGVPDPEYRRSETIDDHRALLVLLAELDVLHLQHRSPTAYPRTSPVYQASQLSYKTALRRMLHQQWDQIQPLINVFASRPRSDIDNEMSIGIVSHTVVTYSAQWDGGPTLSWIEVRPVVHLPRPKG